MRLSFVSLLLIGGALLSSAPASAWPTRNPELLTVELRNVAINYLNMNEINKRKASSAKREQLTGPHGPGSSNIQTYLAAYGPDLQDLVKNIQTTNKMPLEFTEGGKVDFEEMAYKDKQKAYDFLFDKVFVKEGEGTYERVNAANKNRGRLLKHEIATGISYGVWNQQRAHKAKTSRSKILAGQIKGAPNLRSAQATYSMGELNVLIEAIAQAQTDIHYAANSAALTLLGIEAHNPSKKENSSSQNSQGGK